MLPVIVTRYRPEAVPEGTFTVPPAVPPERVQDPVMGAVTEITQTVSPPLNPKPEMPTATLPL